MGFSYLSAEAYALLMSCIIIVSAVTMYRYRKDDNMKKLKPFLLVGMFGFIIASIDRLNNENVIQINNPEVLSILTVVTLVTGFVTFFISLLRIAGKDKQKLKVVRNMFIGFIVYIIFLIVVVLI